jgi:hypothetical protein
VVSRRPQERRFGLRQGAARNRAGRGPASLNRDAASTRVLDGHVDVACERDRLFFGEHAPDAAGTDDDDPMT